jgi:hypothetical protein
MHRRSVARLAALIASVPILVLLAAPTVLGKEGVSVNLVAPLPRDAQPGTTVPAVFTMEATVTTSRRRSPGLRCSSACTVRVVP